MPLYWYMLSQKFLDYASNCGSRSVLPKINQKELGEIPVPIMTSNEQKEVVKILDKLIEEEKVFVIYCKKNRFVIQYEKNGGVKYL